MLVGRAYERGVGAVGGGAESLIMAESDKFKVTQLEAATRQLKEAVRMFFDGRDIVALHTVVCAAHQIVTDLGKLKGWRGVFRNKEIIKPDRWKEYISRVKEPENFFKHADHNPDPSAEIEFSPIVTQLFLLDAQEVHLSLLGKRMWESFVFQAWMTLKYPDLFYEPIINAVKKVAEISELDPDDLSTFSHLFDPPFRAMAESQGFGLSDQYPMLNAVPNQ